MDWNAFNEDMQNMANSMQQMMPPPMFNQPQIPQQMQFNQNIPTQINHHHHVHHQHHQHHQHQQHQQEQQPQPQQYQHQQIIMPSIQMNIPQIQTIQPMQPINHQNIPRDGMHNNFANQMNDFAQQITAYSQQMVQYGHAITNAIHQNQQNDDNNMNINNMNNMNNIQIQQSQNNMNNMNNNNAAIVLVDNGINIIQNIQAPLQQIIISHNNNGHPSIHEIHHNVSFVIINTNNNNFNNNNLGIIDLTNNDEEEEETEDEKEQFVPWTDEQIPDEFKCPISLEIMNEPVLCSDGFYYERECIVDWLHHHNRSPMTNLTINNPTIQCDHHLKSKIIKWIQSKWDKYIINHCIITITKT